MFFYEAIQVTVNITGRYSFSCNSRLDTYGYFYVNEFNPSRISVNQLDYNDDGGGNAQFQFTRLLQADERYVLVVTTFLPNVTGSFSLRINGPADASSRRINNVPAVTSSVVSTAISSESEDG